MPTIHAKAKKNAPVPADAPVEISPVESRKKVSRARANTHAEPASGAQHAAASAMPEASLPKQTEKVKEKEREKVKVKEQPAAKKKKPATARLKAPAVASETSAAPAVPVEPAAPATTVVAIAATTPPSVATEPAAIIPSAKDKPKGKAKKPAEAAVASTTTTAPAVAEAVAPAEVAKAAIKTATKPAKKAGKSQPLAKPHTNGTAAAGDAKVSAEKRVAKAARDAKATLAAAAATLPKPSVAAAAAVALEHIPDQADQILVTEPPAGFVKLIAPGDAAEIESADDAPDPAATPGERATAPANGVGPATARSNVTKAAPETAPRNKDRTEVQKTDPDTPRPSPVLTHKTQEIFTRLREQVGFPVVAYWTSSTGSICQNDVMAMSHLIAEVPRSDTVGLFLKSDGGNPEAALRLVHLLRNVFKRIVLFAPFECASAATMVALGSNEVHMGRTSYLTAVDTSLKHQLSPIDHGNDLVSVSQDEVSRILRLWKDQKTSDNPYPEVYKYLHPLVIGALDRSSSLSIRICAELLSYHLKDKTRSEAISRELNSSYPSHSYPITATEALRLGLNVKDLDPSVERSLRELNIQYSTMAHPLITDYDEGHYHINEICNILEINGRQIFYSVNKDWYYRKEERRWSPMKDKSSWKSVTKTGRKWTPMDFFIR